MSTTTHERDNGVGDVLAVDPDPVLHSTPPTGGSSIPPSEPLPHVIANFTLAHEATGALCIRWGKYALTAAEAHKIAVELTATADKVAEVRTQLGFES